MSTKKPNKKTKTRKPVQIQIEDLESIAKKMHEINLRRLPDGVIRDGVLRGLESEIRQEALIMAVGGFLQRNQNFQLSKETGETREMENALEKCSSMTLKFAKERIASQATRQRSRETSLSEWKIGFCDHPAQAKPSEWSVDQKALVVLKAVRRAVQLGKLSPANSSVMSMIFLKGMKPHEVATLWKVSDSAVYQQIRRVRRVIPEVMDVIETGLE